MTPNSAAARRMTRTDESSIFEYPPRAYLFFRRLFVLPFEAAIALLAIWSGVAALMGITTAGQVFNQAFPPAIVSGFNVLYMLSGCAILGGLGWGYRNLEASGLILLMMSLTIRAVALFVTVGSTAGIVSTLFSSTIFAIATLLRFVAILKRGTIVQINGKAVTVE